MYYHWSFPFISTHTLNFVGLVRTAEVDFPNGGQIGVFLKGADLDGQWFLFGRLDQVRKVALADFSRTRIHAIVWFKTGERSGTSEESFERYHDWCFVAIVWVTKLAVFPCRLDEAIDLGCCRRRYFIQFENWPDPCLGATCKRHTHRDLTSVSFQENSHPHTGLHPHPRKKQNINEAKTFNTYISIFNAIPVLGISSWEPRCNTLHSEKLHRRLFCVGTPR